MMARGDFDRSPRAVPLRRSFAEPAARRLRSEEEHQIGGYADKVGIEVIGMG